MTGETRGSIYAVTVGVTSIQIVGASSKRKSIAFSANAAAQVTIDDSSPAVLNGGINLNQSNPIQVLRYEDYGDMVRGPFYAIASGAGTVIGVVEALEG